MLVFVTAITFTIEDTITLEALPNSDFGTMMRRSNKVATLDGGVAVNDFGYTDADREFIVNVRPTRAEDELLSQIVRNHGQVHVSTREGFYKAIPQYQRGRGTSILRLSITEQLAGG